MLVVRWPDGEETRLTDVAANQLLEVKARRDPAISISLLIAAVAVSAAGCFGSGGSDSYVLKDCKRRDLGGTRLPGSGRGAPERDPARHTRADGARQESVPHLGGDVGRLGRLRPRRRGVLRGREAQSEDVQAAREAAISYAAYRILLHRYSLASGLQETFDELTSTMESLCYRIEHEDGWRLSRGLRNRIAAAVIAYGRNDGADEALRNLNPDHKPVNAPLFVEEHGNGDGDPNRWQPLALAKIVAQNGIPVPGKVRPSSALTGGTSPASRCPSPEGSPLTRDPLRSSVIPPRTLCSRRTRSPSTATAAASTRTRRDSRRQPGRARWQHTGDERRRRPQRQPGDRPSLRSGHRSSW